MVNGWKVVAIIFIILFILETASLVFFWRLGTNMIEKETECSVNVCQNYDAFAYDDYAQMCYCYTGNEIALEQYIN